MPLVSPLMPVPHYTALKCALMYDNVHVTCLNLITVMLNLAQCVALSLGVGRYSDLGVAEGSVGTMGSVLESPSPWGRGEFF